MNILCVCKAQIIENNSEMTSNNRASNRFYEFFFKIESTKTNAFESTWTIDQLKRYLRVESNWSSSKSICKYQRMPLLMSFFFFLSLFCSQLVSCFQFAVNSGQFCLQLLFTRANPTSSVHYWVWRICKWNLRFFILKNYCEENQILVEQFLDWLKLTVEFKPIFHSNNIYAYMHWWMSVVWKWKIGLDIGNFRRCVCVMKSQSIKDET